MFKDKVVMFLSAAVTNDEYGAETVDTEEARDLLIERLASDGFNCEKVEGVYEGGSERSVMATKPKLGMGLTHAEILGRYLGGILKDFHQDSGVLGIHQRWYAVANGGSVLNSIPMNDETTLFHDERPPGSYCTHLPDGRWLEIVGLF